MGYKINPIPADTGGYGVQRMPQKAVVIEQPTVVAATPAVTTATAPVDNGYNAYIAALNQYQADYNRQQAELKAQQQALKEKRDAAVNLAYDNAKDSLGNAKKATLQDRYVAYMQGLKAMPQVSAVNGNGGYAQSLATKQRVNYENNRAATQQSYLDALKELESDKAAGLLSNEESYLTGIQNMENNANTYLQQLASLQESFKAQQPAVTASAPVTTTGEYKYKVGGQTMSRAQLLEYLASIGLTTEQAKRYMETNKLNP